MTKVIASVTNDLSTDQRLHKVCSTLTTEGYDVILVGRARNDSPVLNRSYKTKRMRLLFNKGALFYAAYNVRLFFFLLFNRCDILVANDLDTLLANYMAAKIKGIPLIYDTHEYFCGMPELTNRPFVRSVWKGIEGSIFPKLQHILTVNESVANLYREEYGKEIQVVKNYPLKSELPQLKSRKELNLPEDVKIIIYQGAVNVDRGLEEVIAAMQWVNNALLLIIGTGNAYEEIHTLVSAQGHCDRILLKGVIPFEELSHYTRNADVGLAIEKDNNLNYKFSLSNKLFDYIHAEIPILSSRLVENERLLAEWEVGKFIDNHDPRHIAAVLTELLTANPNQERWAKNLSQAKKQLTWEVQTSDLLNVYKAAQKR